MVKVWKDLSEMTSTQVPQKYWELEDMMKEVPKHGTVSESDKKKKKKKVYRKR